MCQVGYRASSNLFLTGDDAEADVLVESPLPYALPLPSECKVPGTTNSAHSYNQGQCSRQPCQTSTGPCSLFWHCCFEVGQVSALPLSCSDSSRSLYGTVIVTCECQPCEKQQAHIQGQVFSSRGPQEPVILAAVLLGNEIVTFTDQRGRFAFDLMTIEGGVSLLIQEVHHRPVEVDIDLRPSLTPDVVVTMEYVQKVMFVEKMQLGWVMAAPDDAEVSESAGINVSISMSPHSLMTPGSYEEYTGSGHILHSLYHMDLRPDFTSAALQSMIYHDSKNVHFSIQSHVMGSIRAMGETGKLIQLKPGHKLTVKVAIRFDVTVKESEVEGLHMFSYSDEGVRWIDHGRVMISSIQRQDYRTWVTLQNSLREVNTLWAVGFPSRVSCYIKSKVSHLLTKQPQVGISLQLEQSMMNLDRPSFYFASARTIPGEGVCLKAVCELGGMIYISDTAVGKEVYKMAVSPSTEHAVIMGDQDEVLFYNVDRNGVSEGPATPYYPSEEECMAGGDGEVTGSFDFFINTSLSQHIPVPPVLTPVAAAREGEDHHSGSSTDSAGHCYIKVSVYNCADYTDIQVLSYSPHNHSLLLSMSLETVAPPASQQTQPSRESCLEADVMKLRAACLKYNCGSDVHVSAASRSPEELQKPAVNFTRAGQSCRYWSSHSSLTNRMHVSQDLTSFHVLLGDEAVLEVSNGGLYSAVSDELAVLQCRAGEATRPAREMQHQRGTAVTFICS